MIAEARKMAQAGYGWEDIEVHCGCSEKTARRLVWETVGGTK